MQPSSLQTRLIPQPARHTGSSPGLDSGRVRLVPNCGGKSINDLFVSVAAIQLCVTRIEQKPAPLDNALGAIVTGFCCIDQNIDSISARVFGFETGSRPASTALETPSGSWPALSAADSAASTGSDGHS